MDERSRLTVGVVGLGNMGAAVARRLLEGGCEVYVHDVRPEAMANLQADGARAIGSVSKLGDIVDTLWVALPTADASLSVSIEASRSSRVKTYIETSTLGRETLRRIVEHLSAAAVDVIDAPVSGGPKAAANGSLGMMVAGSPPALERVRPLLSLLASRIVTIGHDPGMAQVAKIVNNAISLSSLVISSEALVVGTKAGIDPRTLLEAINAGTGRNDATLAKIPSAVLTRTFDYGGPIALAVKDLELYSEEASMCGLEGLSIVGALELFRRSVQQLGPTVDYTEVIRQFEESAGISVSAPGLAETTSLRGTHSSDAPDNL